jgi:hypothetical protein
LGVTDVRSSAFLLRVGLLADSRGNVDTDARFGSSINDRLITAAMAPANAPRIRIPF